MKGTCQSITDTPAFTYDVLNQCARLYMYVADNICHNQIKWNTTMMGTHLAASVQAGTATTRFARWRQRSRRLPSFGIVLQGR